MALRGRKPNPGELHLITGNPGKRPVNEQAPVPEGEVKKPAFVKGRAARIWRQYAASLEAQGVLTAWDVDTFGAWCCLMAEFQEDPRRMVTAKITQMRVLGESFGLLPTGRARLKTGAGKKETADPAEKYFGRPG